MTTTPNGEAKSTDDAPAFIETPAGADGVAPDTGVAKIDVGDHQLSSPDSFALEQKEAEKKAAEDAPKKPAKNGKHEDWIVYANKLGVDSSGSRADIVSRIEESEARDKATQIEAKEDEPSDSFGKALKDLPSDKLPISAHVGDLLLSVETNKAGLRVLNVSMFGYLGDVPVSILAEHAGDFREALDRLESQTK